MNDSVFLQAYNAVAASMSDDAWRSLSPGDQTRLIYEEMRRIDAESVRDMLPVIRGKRWHPIS
jgi:hypothetical protein